MISILWTLNALPVKRATILMCVFNVHTVAAVPTHTLRTIRICLCGMTMTLRYAFRSAGGFNSWIFKLLAGNHDDDAQKISLDAFYDTGGPGTDLSHHSVLPSVAFALFNTRLQHSPALSDFEILQPPQITRKSITTTQCRNRGTGKLFTLKSKRVDSQAVSRWPEQLFLEYMRDFPSTQVQTAFIPYLHAVFQEGEQMYLVLVRRLP